MELQRFARSALGSLSSLSRTTTLTAAAMPRVFTGAAPFVFSTQRQLSVTALRRTLPSSAPRAPPSSSSSSWPPKRAPAPTESTSPAAAATPTSTTASNPLKDLYSSDNPAQWAMWSSDDFHKRHLGGDRSGRGGGRGGGRDSSNSADSRVKLRPITGRTVYVGGQIDQARAFYLAEAMAARNGVRRDFQQQRFHMRPGLKRKHLSKVRNKRKWDRTVKAAVMRVCELKKQGW